METGGEKAVKAIKAFNLVAILLICFVALTMAISFVLGPYIVFNSSIGKEIVGKSSDFYIFFIGLAFSFKSNIQSLFISEWVIYLSIFTILAVTGKEQVSKFLREKRVSMADPFSNNLMAAISIFSITVVIVLVVDWIQYNVGIETGNLPEMNPAELLCIISHAPLAEEIGFRLSLIGLFSIVFLKGWRKKISLIDYLISPIPTLRSRLKDTEYDEKRVHAIFLPLILASGTIFGLAHIMPSSVWEVGKATEAAFAGIMLGIAYSYYNIGVAILIHWAFNYYSNTLYIFEENFVNIGLSNIMDTTIVLLGSILILRTILASTILKKERTKEFIF
jgi:hypothetical protein